MQTRHAKRNSHEQNNYLSKVIQDPGRIFCSYFQLEKLNPLLNGHLAEIKSLMLQKGSKNSLKCFRGQILSETKTTGNQCWNAQETHRPHDLSIGKYHLLCQKQESFTAYSTSISRVQVLSDHALFLCSARMDQGGFHCVTKGIVV